MGYFESFGDLKKGSLQIQTSLFSLFSISLNSLHPAIPGGLPVGIARFRFTGHEHFIALIINKTT